MLRREWATQTLSQIEESMRFVKIQCLQFRSCQSRTWKSITQKVLISVFVMSPLQGHALPKITCKERCSRIQKLFLLIHKTLTLIIKSTTLLETRSQTMDSHVSLQQLGLLKKADRIPSKWTESIMLQCLMLTTVHKILTYSTLQSLATISETIINHHQKRVKINLIKLKHTLRK